MRASCGFFFARGWRGAAAREPEFLCQRRVIGLGRDTAGRPALTGASLSSLTRLMASSPRVPASETIAPLRLEVCRAISIPSRTHGDREGGRSNERIGEAPERALHLLRMRWTLSGRLQPAATQGEIETTSPAGAAIRETVTEGRDPDRCARERFGQPGRFRSTASERDRAPRVR